MTQAPLPKPDRARARRVELILKELEALPTLSSVAVRLLELTTDAEAEATEVCDLVASDPALATRVLALCRCHERGRANDVTSVERAVLLLGFEAVRTAVLAVQVFDVFDQIETPGGERPGAATAFDREAFWLHSLAVAVVAEELANRGRLVEGVSAGTAFTAGLLHDLGQLVLHVLLPESFDRVCQVTETHGTTLDHACRQIIGLDTHTVGKKIAEQWGLPQDLVDIIWLNGQPYEALPEIGTKRLVAVVTLADALVRSRYITAGGHWSRGDRFASLMTPVGITQDELDGITAELHDRVTHRAEALGLNVAQDPRILLRSISRANKSLARANAGMRAREQRARTQSVILESISEFHEHVSATSPIVDVLAAIARSAPRLLGGEVHAALYAEADDDDWHVVRFGDGGRPRSIRSADPPSDGLSPSTLLDERSEGVPLTTLLPWLLPMMDVEGDEDELTCFALPASGGAGGSAVLVLRRDEDAVPVERAALGGIVGCWTSALEAGAEHEFAGQVTEQLAAANRSLSEMQEVIARHRTMATVGEIAAGAAHEMNNPLTIISGRAQLLATRVDDPVLLRATKEIREEASRLSDMISALRQFAEPAIPERKPVDVANLVMRAVQQYGPGEKRFPQVNTLLGEALPPAHVDLDMIRTALGELVRNACESRGARHIELRVSRDPVDDALRLEVRDDGSGLGEQALQHAFDPFFSDKPAGRQPGLGLSRASRYVEAHGGRVALVNAPGGGAIATIHLPDWRGEVEAAPEPATAADADDVAFDHGGREAA